MSEIDGLISKLEGDIKRARPVRKTDTTVSSQALDCLHTGGTFTVMHGGFKMRGKRVEAGDVLDLTGEQPDYVVRMCESRQILPTAALEQAEKHRKMQDIYEQQVQPLKEQLARHRAEHDRAAAQLAARERSLRDAERVYRETAGEVTGLEQQLTQVLASAEVLAVFAGVE